MSTSVFNKYAPNYDFAGKRVLNIGCGFAKFSCKNVVNVDKFPICSPDVVHDLEKTPYPFSDGEFDHIVANHIFEHLHNWWKCFEECGRILKPNGTLEIWVPHFASDEALGFRDHVTIINHNSFFGTFSTFREGGNAWAVENAKSHANRLKYIKTVTSFRSKKILRLPKFVLKWMLEHLRNMAKEEGYLFRKVTEEEFKAHERMYEERNRTHTIVPVPRMPKNPLHG